MPRRERRFSNAELILSCLRCLCQALDNFLFLSVIVQLSRTTIVAQQKYTGEEKKVSRYFHGSSAIFMLLVGPVNKLFALLDFWNVSLLVNLSGVRLTSFGIVPLRFSTLVVKLCDLALNRF